MRVSAAILLFSITAFAQSRPKFDSADVHTAPQTTIRFMRGGDLHGTRYEIRNASMLDLISTAYEVDSDKIFGGPSWIEFDRFDVIAIAPAKTPPETLDLMLQSLLADRFQVELHQESRSMPAYALVVGKHLQMTQSDGSGEPGCKQSVQDSGGAPPTDAPVAITSLTLVLTCRETPMSLLAQRVPVPRRQGEVVRPVIDKTGLSGNWNFEFKYPLGSVTGDLAPISDLLDKQLGVKLEPTTQMTPVIDVRSANRKPTPNSPEEMKSFPPLPTEFDVAEIKPSKPAPADDMAGRGGIRIVSRAGAVGRGGRGGGLGGQQLQNGRLTLQGYTMKDLISLGWKLPNTDMLVGAPKWMDTDRFDVIAKVPGGPAADAFTDMDSILPMLRALLLDRFKMKLHNEDRPLPGYVLTAAKPKLKKADPAGRTRWINGPGADGKDPRNGNTAVGRLVTCQNMTMSQFADLLPNIASGYLRGTSVADKTGLEGAWDFTFYFSAAGLGDGGGRGGDSGASAGAADPSGGMPLGDALTKLLGLKLEMQTRPLPVLVVDEALQKPTDN